MQKSLILIALFLAAITGGVFLGCSEDDPSAGVGPGYDETAVTSIELRVPHTLITGLPDEARTEQITAIARNAAGVGVPNVKLRFGIREPDTYKGTITTSVADSVTNDNGQITATYSVILERNAEVTIFAQAGQISAEKTIQLRVRDNEGMLSIRLEKEVLTVPPGQTKTTNVIATLTDEEGLAIPGVQMTFSTSPARLGAVDSDTGMTDNSGRVTRRFSSIVNQYGVCTITTRVGNDTEASVDVEIRPVAGPRYISIHADPQTMKIAEGTNARSTITAVVTDSTGVGVPLTSVLFELEGLGGEPIFGSLTSIDTTTNADGEIWTTFNSRGRYGQQYAVARVIPSDIETGDGQQSAPDAAENLKLKLSDGRVADFDREELSKRILITVEPLADAPRSMTITATPDLITTSIDSTANSIIRATVRDENRNGIPNLPINFRTDLGTLARPTVTDSSGVASVQFFVRPSADMTPPNERATATITASIPGTGWEASAEVEIRPVGGEEGTLTLETDRRFIWADGPGLSTARLTAILKDSEGQILSGENIIFTSSFESSVVGSPVITDSLGRAMSIFDDAGRPSIDPNTGQPDSVLVTARYQGQEMDLRATTRIMIRERNPVSTINLSVNARQLRANSGDSTAVRATCYFGDGSPATEGTEVRFESIYGSFTQSVVNITGRSGAANTYYIAGNQVTTDTLIAYVWTPIDTAVSNEVLVDLISGPAATIVVRAQPTILVTNDPEAFSNITATVLDTSGNPVRQGTFVTFSTDRGTITPSSITDENGDAIARLTPGVESGVAVVTASTQGNSGPIEAQATVTFVSGTPNQIQLTADPLEIQVAGTGGNSTSTLRATVRDPNGNLVEHPVSVVFGLINEPAHPEGCSFGQFFEQTFVSRTSNGVAVASLNAGTQIGGKLIRAYTWPDSANEPDHTVQVILSTVAVVSGPPFQLDIDVNDDGEDAGGGAWGVEVSARVWDIHRNPVADRIPVVFTVDPEIANISPGHTGNEGQAGAPVKGLAYAQMHYNSVNTFDPITISAEVQTEQGQIQGSREHILPMQEGELELNVDPGNWMFNEENPDAVIRCWVVLKDGHQILINNAPILFTSNRSRFSWRDFSNDEYIEFFPEPARKFTGVIDRQNNEEPGQATVYLLAEEGDIFLDPFTLEVTVQINAAVEGYDDVQADPGFIFFTRPG